MACICKAQANMALASGQRVIAAKPFTSIHQSRRVLRVHAAAASSEELQTSRRQLLQVGSLTAMSALLPGAAFAAKAPKGFNPVQDLNDNYQFLYPFGWQEVAVTGADVVYKDVVEPLESISVTLTPTDRRDIDEFGDAQEVANTLAKEVLTTPGQEVEVLAASERETNGKKYYEFEFTAKSPRYTRHSLAVVTVNDGKFYTLTTGANERRWGKMKDKLQASIRSFTLINVA